MQFKDLSQNSPFSFQKLDKVDGLVIHHTGGRGTPESVMDTFKQRGLPAQYIMDRDGTVIQALPDGMRGQHIRPSEINGLSNANSVGIEIIANDDSDLTPEQKQAAMEFATYAGQKYGFPAANVFGHGEVNSHKQATEGSSVVKAWREANRIAAPEHSAPAAQGGGPRTLMAYAGKDSLPQSPYEEAFANASKATGVPVAVLRAMGIQESGLDPNKTGKAGEVGLTQILPSTAQSPGYGVAPVDPASLRDPAANIMFGAQYLANKGKAVGATDLSNPQHLAKALTAYNGGGDPNYASNVMRYINGQPQPGMTVTARKPTPPDPGMFAEAPPQSMGMPAQPQAPQRMTPDAFRQSVFNGPDVASNPALDYRLKEDAAQRGYASWNPQASSPNDAPKQADPFAAIKGMFPQGGDQQAMLAKILSGSWG